MNFLVFAQCGKTRNLLLCKSFFVHSIQSKVHWQKVDLTEFLRKNGGSRIPYFPHCVYTGQYLTQQSTNQILAQKFREINFFTFRTHSVEKSSITRSLFLPKIQHFFRQINVFTKEDTKELISRKFLSVIVFYSIFPHWNFSPN